MQYGRTSLTSLVETEGERGLTQQAKDTVLGSRGQGSTFLSRKGREHGTLLPVHGCGDGLYGLKRALVVYGREGAI